MLDTLRYSKRLQNVGFNQEQAEAQAEALRDEISESVATREQLENATRRLDAKIEAVEQRLSAEITSLHCAIGLSAGLAAAVLGMTTAVLIKLLI
ncbi:MAG: hypothetical protein L0H73_01035 [Nitrococcus sp.]|nr:hypothetical protein [Nitrococcus sp.]